LANVEEVDCEADRGVRRLTMGAAADPDGRALDRGVGSGLLPPLADGFGEALAGRIGVTV
jgi:hypothetical protein